jgi:hypothetical protein
MRGFVIGSGPSITLLQDEGFDFSRLEGEEVVAVNQSFKLFKCPKYITSTDRGFMNRNRKVLPPNSTVIVPEHVITKGDDSVCQISLDENTSNLPTNLTDDFPHTENSGALGILVAYVLGLDPIYLFGLDAVIHEGRIWHHKDYGRWTLNSGQVKEMSYKIEAVITMIEEKGGTVISCSPISRLNERINYISIEEILNVS